MLMSQLEPRKTTYYRYGMPKNRNFFAGFLQLAYHNAFAVISDVCLQLRFSFNDKDDTQIFNNKLFNQESAKTPEDQLKILELLNNRFPFLETMAKNYVGEEKKYSPDFRDVIDFVRMMIEKLQHYRGINTHLLHKPAGPERELIALLRKQFDEARITAKDKFGFKGSELTHLVRLTKTPRMEKPQEPQGFRYGFADKANHLTEKGMVFFICLFLTKAEARQLLNYIEHVKDTRQRFMQATFKVFTSYCVRLPRPRLESSNDRPSLLLDMLNELQKCPGALFTKLSNEDQDKFIPLPDEVDDAADPTKDKADDDLPPPFLRRYGNRFFHHALRFMDTEEILGNMKFQVDLGVYCFHTYDQKIDGETRIRRLHKRITDFGRLSYYSESVKPPEWQQLVQSMENRQANNKSIYMADTYPHYHVVNNQIGFRFEDQEGWPSLELELRGGSQIPKPKKKKAPLFTLSLEELPGMVFYYLLQRKEPGSKTIRDIIVEHKRKIHKIYTDIINGVIAPTGSKAKTDDLLSSRNLNRQQIPEKIIHALDGKKIQDWKLLADKIIIKKIAEGEKLLASIEAIIKQRKEEKSPAAGSKDFKDVKGGHIADYIAKDMLYFQPALLDSDGKKTAKGKANGTEFSVLQAKLALYDKERYRLKDTFRLLNLVNSKNPHPFLHKLDPESITTKLAFYSTYLEERHEYLYKCYYDDKFETLDFLVPGKAKKIASWDDIMAYAERMMAQPDLEPDLAKRKMPQPVLLPRSLFIKPTIELVKQSQQLPAAFKQSILEAEQGKGANMAFMIKAYLLHVKNDRVQHFYDFKRNYELLDKLFDTRAERSRDELAKKFYTESEILGMKDKIEAVKEKYLTTKIKNSKEARVDKNVLAAKLKSQVVDIFEAEKLIRFYKTCDSVNSLVCEALVGEMTASSAALPENILQLETFAPNIIQPLSTPISLSLPLVIDEGNKKFIEQAGVNLKNYGSLRKFCYDRRSKGLVQYIHATKIPVQILEGELRVYEEIRKAILLELYDFEKRVVELIPTLRTSFENSPKSNLSYNEVLEAIGANKEDDQYVWSKEIRNAFNHSTYPPYPIFKDLIQPTETIDFSDRLADQDFGRITKQFLTILKQTHEYFIANYTLR
jgi:hypothetical protein